MTGSSLLEAARLSALIYWPHSEIKKAEPASVFFSDDTTGAQAALFPRENHSLVVWRGTQFTSALNSREWCLDLAANARVVRTDWPPGGTAHRGYAAAVRSLVPRIARELRHLPRPVCITGHSMGGVAATLHGSLSLLPAVSFGAPAPGDSAFWQTVPYIQRVVLGHDPAPKYPPPWWPLSYRQSPAFLHLWDDGRIHRKTWKTWSHGIVRPFTKRGLMLAAKWHDVDRYALALRRVADACLIAPS